MKSKLINVLLVILFLAGLSLLLYPTVSSYYNAVHQTRAILSYVEDVDQLEEQANERLLEEARAYNRDLAEGGQFSPDLERYHSLLDASGTGIMAYVEIPSIEVTLPILHGTEDTVLDKAVGHLDWTSLPVGGESTHCVISGHRGLPSSELFTNIDHLEIGDTFYIHVLGQTLEYWVDQILVVLPHEFDDLTIVPGQDYCTLLTCTPYGINSHRLLVRGARVEGQGTAAGHTLTVTNEVTGIDIMVIVPVALVVLSVLVFGALLLEGGKKRKKQKGEEPYRKEE